MAAELRYLGYFVAFIGYTIAMLSFAVITRFEFLPFFVLYVVIGIAIIVAYGARFGFAQHRPARFMPLVISLCFICLTAFLVASQLLGLPFGNEHHPALWLTLKIAGLIGSLVKFSRDLRLLVRGSSAPRPPRRSPLMRRVR